MLIDYLKQTYGDNLLTANGQTYPVYVFEPDAAQYNDVDSILAPDIPHTFDDPATYPIYDAAHLEHLKQSKPGLHNGITFDFAHLNQYPLKITANLGHYYHMLATCDALDHELRRYSRGKQNSLPLRDQFHRQIPPQTVLTDGSGRGTVIGVCALTVFNDEGRYKFILAQRSQSLGVGAGMFHVVPAFVFQPSGPQAFYPVEWSVEHQVYREFGEELFGMPEYNDYARQHTTPTADYIYAHPAVQELKTMTTDGRAALHLTGAAFNPLSLRLEITIVLVIHDSGWFRRWQPQLQAALFTERQHTDYIPLDTLDGLPVDLPLRMAPHGAAAMWSGIRHARMLLQ